MEWELARHDWASLPSPFGDATALPDAIRELCRATDRAEAERAVRRIAFVLPLQQPLSEASVATAAVLVRGLLQVSETVVDLVLQVLADLAAGFGEATPHEGRSVLHRQCLAEIVLGFPSYAMRLEAGPGPEARAAAVDLVAACGLAEPRLATRADDLLRRAAEQPELEPLRDLIGDCREELAARVAPSAAGVLDPAMEAAIRIAVDLLVRGQYVALEAMTRGRRLAADDLERAVREYGRTLVPLPEKGWREVDVIPVQNSDPPEFHVEAPLWTAEEGLSDLVLELTMTALPQAVYDIQVADLHVM